MTPRREHKGAGLELLQGDLSMNFFIILMVILAALSIAAVATVTDGFRSNVEIEADPDRPLALINSWAPTRSLRPRLLVREGVVYRMQLDAFARNFAAGERFLPSTGIDASNHLPDDPDPAAHRIILQLLSNPVPDTLYSWSLPAEAFAQDADAPLPAAILSEIEAEGAYDIYLSEGEGEEAAWDLAAYLTLLNKRVTFRYVRKGQFAFQRRSNRFTFVDVYK